MATSLVHGSGLSASRNACQSSRRSVRAHVAAVQRRVADVASMKAAMSVDTAKLEALAEEAFRKAKEVGRSARMIADEALYRRAMDTEVAPPQLPLARMEERTTFAAAASGPAEVHYEQANAGVLSQLEAQAMEAARCAMAAHAAALETVTHATHPSRRRRRPTTSQSQQDSLGRPDAVKRNELTYEKCTAASKCTDRLLDSK
eukprot:XP_001699067.1 predicted protein [Chlamydomonas reinhardtii]